MSFLYRSLSIHSPAAINLVTAAIDRAITNGMEAPGIAEPETKQVFAKQLIESIRRIQYVLKIADRDIHPNRADPACEIFDPVRASAFRRQQGNAEEAAWLVFLLTHFGYRPATKWGLVRAFYRGDHGGPWTWDRAVGETAQLFQWISDNVEQLKAAGRFGNHRKYESLETSTKRAIRSYVEWVHANGSHRRLFAAAERDASHDAKIAFAILYQSMSAVERFGRMGRFDYISMLGKVGIAGVWPGSMFLAGSTGPIQGGKLMFGQDASATEIQARANLLDDEMHVGMQVFEDALCNWQKSPEHFISFRG